MLTNQVKRIGRLGIALTAMTVLSAGLVPATASADSADSADATPQAAATSRAFVPTVPPGSDPFYVPSAPFTGNPGDVIRQREVVFTLGSLRRPVRDVLSQQVLYRSTSTNGDPIAVSGTVLVPTDPWKGQGPRPLVAVAPGTRGLGDLCAPSYTLTQGTDYEDNFISDLLKRGWAVAMTNYEGLGTPGMHTYMVGRAEGHAVLDIARAASRMAGTGLSPNGPIAVAGYSQGGGAAGWAAQLAPSYAPELQLLGVAAGGVPADLAATVNALNGGPFVVFALLGGVGFDAAYPELQLSNYLNDQGRRLLSHADTACLVNAGALAVALQTPLRNIDDFTTTNPLHVPAWQSRIAENSLGTMTPTVPLFLYHGAADEIVPLGQARRLRQTWCAQGANIQWSLWPGEHVLTMQEASSSVVNWLDDRFTGKPTTSNC